MTNERKKISVPLTIFLVIIFSVTTSYGVFYFKDNQIKQQAKTNEKHEKIREEIKTVQESINTLTAGINYDQRRKFLITQFQEIIWKENKDVSSQNAYKIAENNIDFCDRFKRIDPALLFAIQSVESSFKEIANSRDGARGLNQMIPSTARLLCKYLGWEYSPKLLDDPFKSTYLACTYLDMLHVEYDGNIEQILAEYNGGPSAAYWIKVDPNKTCPDVRNYLKKVLAKKDEYSKISKSLIMGG